MGFAERPATRTTFPETASTIAHLREMLGGQTYESLASDGASMTTAAAVTYALNQIERARADLIATSRHRVVMFGGLFFIGFGLAMVALVVYGDRSVKGAKHTGVRVSAQVIGQEVEVGAKGSRFYHTKVRFPGPNGQWLEHVSSQGH